MTTATAVRERPIPFTGEMVAAILAGRKTQTRRVVKPPLGLAGRVKEPGGHRNWHLGDPNAVLACPYGQPGDRLWCKETWAIRHCGARVKLAPYTWGHNREWPVDLLDYPATDDPPAWNGDGTPHWWNKRPSIHMPRWASRLLLEVTEVRVERVQEISEADARAEGITDGGCLSCGESEPCACANPCPDARDSFAWLWNSINEARGYPWVINPWVWVVSFRRIEVGNV